MHEISDHIWRPNGVKVGSRFIKVVLGVIASAVFMVHVYGLPAWISFMQSFDGTLGFWCLSCVNFLRFYSTLDEYVRWGKSHKKVYVVTSLSSLFTNLRYFFLMVVYA